MIFNKYKNIFLFPVASEDFCSVSDSDCRGGKADLGFCRIAYQWCQNNQNIGKLLFKFIIKV